MTGFQCEIFFVNTSCVNGVVCHKLHRLLTDWTGSESVVAILRYWGSLTFHLFTRLAKLYIAAENAKTLNKIKAAETANQIEKPAVHFKPVMNAD